MARPRSQAKSSSRRAEAPSAQAVAADYIRRLGAMGEQDDPATFWTALIERHGSQATRLRECVESGTRAGCLDRARWELRNATLALSLDVSFGFSGSMYRTTLANLHEVVQRSEPLGRVVDIGCGNGLLSCYIARLCPGAEVHGVDTCHAAVSCARELSAELQLSNARFHAAAAADAHSYVSDADLLLCSRVMTADPVDEAPAPFSLADAPDLHVDDPFAQFVHASARLLGPRGTAVIIERLGSAHAAYRLIQALERQGLVPNWRHSRWLSGHECGTPEHWPLIVASAVAAPTSPEALLEFFVARHESLESAARHDANAAELLYLRRGRKAELVASLELRYHRGGIERLELRRAKDGVFVWHTSTMGFRSIDFKPDHELPTLVEGLRSYARQRSSYALVCLQGPLIAAAPGDAPLPSVTDGG